MFHTEDEYYMIINEADCSNIIPPDHDSQSQERKQFRSDEREKSKTLSLTPQGFRRNLSVSQKRSTSSDFILQFHRKSFKPSLMNKKQPVRCLSGPSLTRPLTPAVVRYKVPEGRHRRGTEARTRRRRKRRLRLRERRR